MLLTISDDDAEVDNIVDEREFPSLFDTKFSILETDEIFDCVWQSLSVI